MTEIGPRRPSPLHSFSDWLRQVKSDLLASSRFQQAATAFPLTRPLARRNARRLFTLTTGFVHSQVLLACVRLDVFEHLREGPRRIADLAEATALTPEACERLLRAAASLDLLSERDGRFALGDLGAALLGNPSVFAMIRHHGDFYADLVDPVALLRREGGPTRLQRFWGYGASDTPAEDTREAAPAYSELMAETQAFIAREVMAAYPLWGHKTLMDVGGGSGAFLVAAGQRAPHLKLILADLPSVAELASTRLAAAGLAERVDIIARDILREPLPEGADLITLIRILHDHDDDDVRALLRSVRSAMPDGGTLLIAEPMAGTKGDEAMGDAYFGLYLWAMGSGRARRVEELTAMLSEAGFDDAREISTRQPLLVRVLVAKPAALQAAGPA